MKYLWLCFFATIAWSCADEQKGMEDPDVETTELNEETLGDNNEIQKARTNKVYRTNEVDILPVFGEECLESQNKWDCTVKSVQQFIDDNIQYPESAVKKGGESLEKVTFVVLPDGTLGKTKYVTSDGYNCDGCQKAAVEAVGKMKNWIPAKKDGRAVPVELTLPVRFALI